MPSTYRTPGVYIEEISKFPASIAQVPTAIPAFVGFTEQGYNVSDKTPVKIKSLLEYEAQFGGEPATSAARPLAVTVDASGNTTNVALSSRFLLYQSLRLFYANGGGTVYIVSVGDYTTAAGATSRDALVDGIDELKKADEPTLLVIPDAYGLGSAGDAGQVHQKMLAHCNNMQDRFAIMDVWHNPAFLNNIAGQDATAFRTNAGTQYLKYGAAYYPELNTTLGPNGVIEPTSFALSDGGGATTLKAVGTAAGDQGIVNYYNGADDLVVLGAAFAGYAGSKTMAQLEADWASTYLDTFVGNDTDARAYLVSLIEILGGMAQLMYNFAPAPTFKAAVVSDLKDSILELGGPLEAQVEALYLLDREYENATITSLGGSPLALAIVNPADFSAPINYDLASVPVPATNPYEAGGVPADVAEAVNKVASTLSAIHDGLSEKYYEMLSLAEDLNSVDNLLTTSKIYSGIVAAIRNTGYTLPPSGAMAGIYAAVDNDRGVWKAPANVSLTAVSSVARKMLDSELDDLNVPNDGQGKSINAIRFFRGKGILVYGARTLAGNDNEWRYIPVRRLFIMVEESVKKATEQMVFEPNDANTWQKVRAMIGNFLTGLWRDGALVGASPEDAFFVKCGLGETMSAQDILEGKMIVEIGMAAVRPAEFIILKFSHKMQES